MSVGIVTDSACSLPAEMVRDQGVHVVPLWLTIGGEQYRDGELELEEVMRRLGEGVTTASPSPGEVAEAVSAADEGDGVVVLTVSAAMSAVYQASRLAQSFTSGVAVEVVDTRTAAGAQGLVVLAASRAARAGHDLQEVKSVAQDAAARARLVATLPSLEHLAHSGRVPGAAAWGARWLGLDPLFEFVAGQARPLRPVRGRAQALVRMVSLLRADVARTGSGSEGYQYNLHVGALYAVDRGPASEMLDQVRAEFAPASSFISAFTPVMLVHTGPGLAGLSYWLEPVTTGPVALRQP